MPTEEQESNLIPFNERTPEDRHNIRSKGGTVSAERRRECRRIRDALTEALTMPTGKGDMTELDDLDDLSADTVSRANLSIQDRMVVSLVKSAADGNVKAIREVSRLMGEDKLEPEVNDTPVVIVDTIQMRHRYRLYSTMFNHYLSVRAHILATNPELEEYFKESEAELSRMEGGLTIYQIIQKGEPIKMDGDTEFDQ